MKVDVTENFNITVLNFCQVTFCVILRAFESKYRNFVKKLSVIVESLTLARLLVYIEAEQIVLTRVR